MITIMDGGMGGELKARLPGAERGLWSAKALVDAPELVVELHQEYIDAGARLIITNTYSTVPSYLAKEGLEGEFERYTALGGALAKKAVAQSGKPVQIAGSLPPLFESYRPDLVGTAEASLPVYAALVRALLPYVDLFLCETMSTADEAFQAASQAKALGEGKPVIVAWTLNEEPGAGLRSGESVETAFARLEALELDGFLFNCTAPEAANAALVTLRELTDKPIGCYVNRTKKVPVGWTLDGQASDGRRQDLTTDYFVELSKSAIAAGATIIGGCCGIGPSDIKALNDAVLQDPLI
ncbi:MAG: homocysteine S-methyltransferase family protein [Proteobacteria bacterium]|nr:homocysteine S-methyltransferase family protein [Pseudomonadota bacterium]